MNQKKPIDLTQSMNLAGKSLLNSLIPSRYNLPTFQVIVNEEYKTRLTFHAPCHNLGRWWDAMLRLENATGFTIPADIKAVMLKNLYKFFDNADDLCFTPPDLDKLYPIFYPHSFREQILALAALYSYWNNRWALEQGRRMLEKIRSILKPNGGWDFDRLNFHNHLVKLRGKNTVDSSQYRGRTYYIGDPDVACGGRLIEGLVWFYRMTGVSLAMELADKLARFHFEHSTHSDGTLNNELQPTHTHSYLNTLNGLLLFGLLTGQKKYVDTVAATYEVTVKQHVVKESGFASHDFQQDCLSEVASPSDAAHIALWLGLNGYPQFLDDVERLVRSRLIPSQITQTPPLKPLEDAVAEAVSKNTLPPNEAASILPLSDYANLNDRMIGGFGCGIEHPNRGNYVYTDVTAAVLHCLTHVYNHIAVRSDAGLKVCLHFDCDREDVRIISERAERAKVTITPKRLENLFIRIPGWTPLDTIKLTVNGQQTKLHMIGQFVYIPRDLLPEQVIMEYGLPTRTSVEKTMGTEFTYTWRGDQITGVSPNTELYPYYSSAPAETVKKAGRKKKYGS